MGRQDDAKANCGVESKNGTGSFRELPTSVLASLPPLARWRTVLADSDADTWRVQRAAGRVATNEWALLVCF